MNGALAHLVGFGRALRAQGLPVGTGRILTFCRAVAALHPLDRESLYWAGRTTLVAHKEHLERFDRAFSAYFGGSAFEETFRSLFGQGMKATPPPALEVAVDGAARSYGVSNFEGPRDEVVVPVIASDIEVLREKKFDELTADDRACAYRLIRELAVRMPQRRSRRYRPSKKGARFDVRRTLRASISTEGEPLAAKWRSRTDRATPLVLLLDVSGSMSTYSRALLQFGFAALAAGEKVEVFCFGTRLTRVTRALNTIDPDRAFEEVVRTVQDWSGGTRIGESIEQMLDRYRSSCALRGATVVVCSDGLERGDPNFLAVQIARLARLVRRIVWVNPLKGDPRYEPLARGMAASLPYVDTFLPGHNVASLEALAEAIG